MMCRMIAPIPLPPIPLREWGGTRFHSGENLVEVGAHHNPGEMASPGASPPTTMAGAHHPLYSSLVAAARRVRFRARQQHQRAIVPSLYLKLAGPPTKPMMAR